MKPCELCGAENGDDDITCVRCGFEFPKSISSDVRDKAILQKYSGKDMGAVRKEINRQHARMRAYLENMDARELKKEELVVLLAQSLEFLKVPAVMGVEDELRFSGGEEAFIRLIFKTLERADQDYGGPTASPATYTKMANALQAMGESLNAMAMIESALLIDPRDDDAQYGKAKLLFYAREYAAARRCLEKLVEGGRYPKAVYLVELIDQLSQE